MQDGRKLELSVGESRVERRISGASADFGRHLTCVCGNARLEKDVRCHRRGQWSWLPSSPLPPSLLPASGRGRDPRRYHRHQRHPITGGLVYFLGGPVYFLGWPCLVFSVVLFSFLCGPVYFLCGPVYLFRVVLFTFFCGPV